MQHKLKPKTNSRERREQQETKAREKIYNKQMITQ
jgi:hypothetical protein